MQKLPQFDQQLATQRQEAEDTGEVSTLDIKFCRNELECYRYFVL